MDVQYIDQVRGVDPGYLDPQVSERVSQAITDVVLDDALERLFGFEPPAPFAQFVNFKDFSNALRRLFQQEIVFQIPEEMYDEKIFAMIDALQYVNGMLEEVRFRLLSCLRS